MPGQPRLPGQPHLNRAKTASTAGPEVKKRKYQISKLPKYIETDIKISAVPKATAGPDPERWWSERSAEHDIKLVLTDMGATEIHIFYKGEVDHSYHGAGVVTFFSRFGKIQYLECSCFPSPPENLRQIYLAAKNLKKIEAQGINYDSLTSNSTELLAPLNIILPSQVVNP